MSAAEFHFEYCGLCGDELENDREWDTGCCDDCADLGPRYERDRVTHPIEACKMRVENGNPVIVFPDGAEMHLELHVTEWAHEEPEHGAPVDMAVETDYDDHIWWSARPERSDVTSVTTEEDFPKVTISPFTEVPDRTEKRSDLGNENNAIQQFCVEPDCFWTGSWEGGSIANDPAIDHLQENPDHKVCSGVAEFYTEFYEKQRAGELDVTREMVDEARAAQEADSDE